MRALTRRPQAARAGVTWVAGALDTPDALERLVEGADAVIHIAGVINGTAQEFRRGNVEGTAAMLDAASGAGIRRFVHVSSLAAREPRLSAYGRSKSESEECVVASGGGWTIVRPPAIYGPRDHEMLELFRVAKSGVLPLPPAGRLSVIAVQDLCRLLLACAASAEAAGRIYEPDDGRPGGWSHAAFGRAIGRALGRRVLPLSTPRRLLEAGAWLGGRVGGPLAKLTPDRVAYFCHPDWVVSPARQPPEALWRPEVATEEGLREAARWYRAEGWL